MRGSCSKVLHELSFSLQLPRPLEFPGGVAGQSPPITQGIGAGADKQWR